jgi:hypothetical protein
LATYGLKGLWYDDFICASVCFAFVVSLNVEIFVVRCSAYADHAATLGSIDDDVDKKIIAHFASLARDTQPAIATLVANGKQSS